MTPLAPTSACPPPDATSTLSVEAGTPPSPARAAASRLFERLLRDGAGLGRELLDGPAPAPWIGPLAGATALSAALFGLAIGVPGGALQAAVSAIKLPLVLLGSAGMTLPLLHMACAQAGLRIAPDRLAALVLQAMATASTAMAGLAPLALVVWLSMDLFGGTDPEALAWYSYRRFVLAIVATGGVGGIVGAVPLLRVVPLRAAVPWVAGLGLAGLQLSWLLRPVIGSPGPFVWLRPLESSGLSAVLDALWAVMGG